MNLIMRILFIVLVAAIASCNSQQNQIEKIGIGFNSKRKILGLPILRRDWKLVNNSNGVFQWIPTHRSKNSTFFSKTVRIQNNKLFKEENGFIGNKEYHTVDGKSFEELYISCLFDKNENILKWDCIHRFSEYKFENMDFPVDKRITKIQADSILKSWRINL